MLKTVIFRTLKANKGKDGVLWKLIKDWRKLVEFFLQKCFEYDTVSRTKLHKIAYSESKNIVKEGRWHSKYRYTAMEVALSIYKSWRKLKKKGKVEKLPEVRRFFLKLYKESNGAGVYKLVEKNDKWFIRIATTPRNFVILPLIVSDYHRRFLDAWRMGKLKLGEAYLRRCSDGSYEIHIVFKGNVEEKKFERRMGVDINEKNVTISILDGSKVIYSAQIDISELSRLDYVYKMIKIRKLQKKLYRGYNPKLIPKKRFEIIHRYSTRWKKRKEQILHVLSKHIVSLATTFQARIVMEDLRNIKSKILKKNRRLNRRLALADFRKLQVMIEYKAKWIGIPVSYINPRNTSKLCPICKLPMTGISQRELFCRNCRTIWDRDFSASINIALRDVARGVRAEVPMTPIQRRRVFFNEVWGKGKICAMKGRYSSSSIAKFGNTYPK